MPRIGNGSGLSFLELHTSDTLHYRVMQRIKPMDKQTISFRLDSEKVSALDTLAETLHPD